MQHAGALTRLKAAASWWVPPASQPGESRLTS